MRVGGVPNGRRDPRLGVVDVAGVGVMGWYGD